MGNEGGSMSGGSHDSSDGGSSNSFGATFAREHRAQGANGTIGWGGKSYSTGRADGRDLRAEAASRAAHAPSSDMNTSWSSRYGPYIVNFRFNFLCLFTYIFVCYMLLYFVLVLFILIL